jgi:hypothetical protein
MAKKSKSKAKTVGTIGGLALAGEVLGKALGQLAKDVVDNLMASGFTNRKAKKKDKRDREDGDVAARLFKALADGPRPVGELVEEAGCLSRLLRVLADARVLMLIEVQEDGEKVALTKAGENAARAVRESGVKKSAARLLD